MEIVVNEIKKERQNLTLTNLHMIKRTAVANKEFQQQKTREK